MRFFFISYKFSISGVFFFFPLLTIHHPLTWSHVQACHGIQGYARYLHATPRCLALMLCNTARRKREDSQFSHLPPNFSETWSPLIPEQEEMIDLLQTMIQFTSDHWVSLLIGFLIFLSYRYVTRLHCLHYVRPIRHAVKLHIIRWSNTFLSDIGTRK